MNRKGQFSIIAALLVAVVLIATVIVTYSTIRNSSVPNEPSILTAIDETNFAVKQVLGFTVGFYGSILQVTGNSSYANSTAAKYLQSGLVNIAYMHPEWGTSFNVISLQLHTFWFTSASYSSGNLGVSYNLTGLGIQGITYSTSCKLGVSIMNTAGSQICLNITKDEDKPLVNLGTQAFKFYHYLSTNTTWELINPTNQPTSFSNGTYLIDPPSGVDPKSYVVQIGDSRGIIVVASSFSRYLCTPTFNSTFCSTAPDAVLVVELLQNGTMRWLGQQLQNMTNLIPIPPVPIKAIHVNQTINGADQEVPFQIEDWASDYKVPLGLSSNQSLFSGRNMLVFLINSNVSKIDIWWDGSDTATQTSYAYTNRYFNDNTAARTLTNNAHLTLQFPFDNSFQPNSTVGSSTCNAKFMRVNGQSSTYGSDQPAWVITNGIVRDIVHQESEWSGGVTSPLCPDFYGSVVLTLPANVTYYTYQLRVIFVKTQQSRTITELRPIRLVTYPNSQSQTENGTAGGYPVVSNITNVSFYNSSTQYWTHHWSQFISGTTGSGIMFTDSDNLRLYCFDNQTSKTGALTVSNNSGSPLENKIEFAPITRVTIYNYTQASDITWYGAVVTFDHTTPIYNNADKTGLWIIVEYPPTVTVNTQA